MLITLSGIDGCGKSTQLAAVENYGATNGYKVKSVWTRGGYTSGCNLLKDMLRHAFPSRMPTPGPSAQRDQVFRDTRVQRLWLCIAIFDLIRVYGIQLRWWLFRNKIVVCDRYIWDTQIDFELMFPHINFQRWVLWKALATLTPSPQSSFLFVLPYEESVRRCTIKYEPFPDSPTIKPLRFLKYQRLAQESGLHAVDACQSATCITDAIMGTIKESPPLPFNYKESRQAPVRPRV